MSKRLPIFYSALLLTGVNLLLRLVGTSFQAYLSGKIGASGIGLLQLVLSVGTMAMVAGTAGIRTSTMYLTAEELGKGRPRNVTWVLSACTRYSLICSCGVSLGIYIFSPQIAEHWIGDMQALPALRIYSVFLPVNCLCGMMVGYFTAANRIGTLAAVEVAEQICTIVVTILLLTFWAGSDPGKACLTVVMGSGIGSYLTLICLIVLRILEKSKCGPRIPVAKRLTGIAVPLALSDDLRTGITTLENLMVPKRLALCPHVQAPLAAFGTVCGMVFPVLMFPAAILFGLTELLVPELARCNAAGSRQRIQYLVKKSLRVAMLYGILCGGILYLSADTLCNLLYRSEDAGQYLRWFSLLAVMLYCDAVTDAMIKGLGQQQASVRYNIFTSAMDVAFLYVLLPRYGIVGYYMSFLITHVINFCLSLQRLLKISQLKIPLHIPILTVAAAPIAVFAASYVSQPILRAGAFSILLFCLLYLMRIIRKEDILWMKDIIRKK